MSITKRAFFVESHLYIHTDDKIHVLVMTPSIVLLSTCACESGANVGVCMRVCMCVECMSF